MEKLLVRIRGVEKGKFHVRRRGIIWNSVLRPEEIRAVQNSVRLKEAVESAVQLPRPCTLRASGEVIADDPRCFVVIAEATGTVAVAVFLVFHGRRLFSVRRHI